MPERIIINYILVRGAPGAITAARTRLLCDDARSPLAGYACRIFTDECSLWLAFASAGVPPLCETESFAACASGNALQHVSVDLLSGAGESRVFDDTGCVEVKELSRDYGLRWLLGAPGLPPIVTEVDDMTVMGMGGLSSEVADWLAKRKKAAR